MVNAIPETEEPHSMAATAIAETTLSIIAILPGRYYHAENGQYQKRCLTLALGLQILSL
jgi:hypothetical protein